MDIVVGATIGLVQTVAGHPLDTVKTLMQNGQHYRGLNLWQLYRGCAYPAAASIAFNAVAFPVFGRALDENPYRAGFLAGLAVSPIEYGFGVGKIRRQTLAAGPLHLKGVTMSTLRTTGAMTAYFGVYSDTKDTVGALAAGGLAGFANWTLTYPFDVLATRQIAENMTIRQAWRSGPIWRGYLPCILRAVLVNSLSFKLYDLAQ